MRTKFIVKPTSVVHDVLNNEAVVMNLDTGLYFTFNEAATQIWLKIAESSSEESELFELAGIQNIPFINFLIAQSLIIRDQNISWNEKDQKKLDPIKDLAQWHTFSDLKDLLLLDPIHDIALNDEGWPEFK